MPGHPPRRGPPKAPYIEPDRKSRVKSRIANLSNNATATAALRHELPNLQSLTVMEIVLVDGIFMFEVWSEGRTHIFTDPADEFPSPLVLAKIVLFVG